MKKKIESFFKDKIKKWDDAAFEAIEEGDYEIGGHLLGEKTLICSIYADIKTIMKEENK